MLAGTIGAVGAVYGWRKALKMERKGKRGVVAASYIRLDHCVKED